MTEWQIEDIDFCATNNDSNTNEETNAGNSIEICPETKRKKCGIIYLSTLPEYMNVTKTREIFSSYGEIGRIFLQPAEAGHEKKRKKKLAKHFTEGWVEFKSKRIAKQVALQLNTTRIAERKKSKFYDHYWNIKYLPRFKWVHLTERLAYERAVHKQRLRNEISQAKREANFISHNFEQSRKLNKHKVNSSEDNKSPNPSSFLQSYHQRKTDKEIFEESSRKKLKSNGTPEEDESDRKIFLKHLFGT